MSLLSYDRKYAMKGSAWMTEWRQSPDSILSMSQCFLFFVSNCLSNVFNQEESCD